MKANILKRINAILESLIVVLSGTVLAGCPIIVMYGTPPPTELLLEGKVTNEANEPLKDIQIVNRGGWNDREETLYYEWIDTLYTDADGKFAKHYAEYLPMEFHDVIANDTTGIYASDSIESEVKYTNENLGGKKIIGRLNISFILKKDKNNNQTH